MYSSPKDPAIAFSFSLGLIVIILVKFWTLYFGSVWSTPSAVYYNYFGFTTYIVL